MYLSSQPLLIAYLHGIFAIIISMTSHFKSSWSEPIPFSISLFFLLFRQLKSKNTKLLQPPHSVFQENVFVSPMLSLIIANFQYIAIFILHDGWAQRIYIYVFSFFCSDTWHQRMHSCCDRPTAFAKKTHSFSMLWWMARQMVQQYSWNPHELFFIVMNFSSSVPTNGIKRIHSCCNRPTAFSDNTLFVAKVDYNCFLRLYL